jgi:hypothetical protein
MKPLEDPQVLKFVSNFVQLLDKAVIDLTRSSSEYFEVLCAYANMVLKKKVRFEASNVKMLVSLILISKVKRISSTAHLPWAFQQVVLFPSRPTKSKRRPERTKVDLESAKRIWSSTF